MHMPIQVLNQDAVELLLELGDVDLEIQSADSLSVLAMARLMQ
jgi:hypothetical protein